MWVLDVMQVAHHYFENGIAYFTRRINRCISIGESPPLPSSRRSTSDAWPACANGEVAPFVGHNAFLRWAALQDAAFVDPADGLEKIWSETNVSEDFDMALRLQMRGYVIRCVCVCVPAWAGQTLSYPRVGGRWATYSKGEFKEGVSLTVDDELNRWQKYAYGPSASRCVRPDRACVRAC
jgi:hypothetical protein